MSEAAPPQRPEDASDGSPGTLHLPSSRPAIVRLPTWVNVVLVLTLFASCSAASTAGDAVNQLVGGSESENAASVADVRDLCRLLGAVAAQQAVDLDATFAGGDADGTCQGAARESSTP